MLIALLLAIPVLRSAHPGSTRRLQPKGGIKGVIQPAEGLEAVLVVDTSAFKVYVTQLNAKTGAFELNGLPPGEYDLLIKSTGHIYEGLALDETADTENPDAPAAPGVPGATPAQLDALTKGVAKAFMPTEDFFNRKDMVRLTGSADHARLFAVQTRTNPVLDPNGDPIKGWVRRIDLVEFAKTGSLWQLKTSKGLLRQVVPDGSKDQTLSLSYNYSPAAGGLLVGESIKDAGRIDLTKLPPGTADSTGTWKGKRS